VANFRQNQRDRKGGFLECLFQITHSRPYLFPVPDPKADTTPSTTRCTASQCSGACHDDPAEIGGLGRKIYSNSGAKAEASLDKLLLGMDSRRIFLDEFVSERVLFRCKLL